MLYHTILHTSQTHRDIWRGARNYHREAAKRRQLFRDLLPTQP